MIVRDIPYKMEQLEQFSVNEFYQKYNQKAVVDFEVCFSALLDRELPETITDAQKASISSQKTDLLMAFISGHLNLMDPKSKVFNAMHEDIGNVTKSGIILPEKSKLIL